MEPRILGERNDALPPPGREYLDGLLRRVGEVDVGDRAARRRLAAEIGCVFEGSVFQGWNTEERTSFCRTWPPGHRLAGCGWVNCSSWPDVLGELEEALGLLPEGERLPALAAEAARLSSAGGAVSELPRLLCARALAARIAAAPAGGEPL